MKIYLVGGAVRDQLLNRPVTERDWVVVGATSQEMLKLGYQQVGKEFPVFLHPKTREEYALARVERKIDRGYKGFTVDTSPDVTLEEDLKRRDLTINAMAMDKDHGGALIDPYGGERDLAARTLRHVSDAFAEDPVRILRVGRFMARYAPLGFTVHPSTILLMRQMVEDGEVSALVAERVFKELDRALTEPAPEKFFQTLKECDALAILFPGIQMDGVGIRALTACRAKTNQAPILLAALLHAYPENHGAEEDTVAALCKRYRTPSYYQKLAQATHRFTPRLLKAKEISAELLLGTFYALDIFRAPKLFQDFLIALEAISETHATTLKIDIMRNAAERVREMPIADIVRTSENGAMIQERIRAARLKLLHEWLG